MKRTMGEVLGLRCNHYYITCRTKEELMKVKNSLRETKALNMNDFHQRRCSDGILIISNEKVPAFRGETYKEWRKLTNMIYTGRR